MKDWKGRKVFIKLKNGRVYSGTVDSVDDHRNGLIFLTLLDKFNKHVCFASGEIEVIQEEKE